MLDEKTKTDFWAALPRALRYAIFAVMALAIASTVEAEEGGFATTGGDQEGEMEQTAQLDPSQQQAWAEQALADGRRLQQRVQSMLTQARTDGDISKVTCLNDKLNQINVSVRSFETRMGQHAAASGNGSGGPRNHHHRVLVILAERMGSLRNESEACVGEQEVVFGRTSVTTEVDPSITDTEVTDVPAENVMLSDRPAPASSYY